MNWTCCMCDEEENLLIARNPWGDLAWLCKKCVPKFNKLWSDDK